MRWGAVLGSMAIIVSLFAVTLGGWALVSTHEQLQSASKTAATPVTFQPIQRGNLDQTVVAAGQIQYAPSPVQELAGLSGTLTWLPAPGTVVSQGGTLYDVNTTPVVLMYGQVPEWRTLEPGVAPGIDVTELAQALNMLPLMNGYYPLPTNGDYTDSVQEAVNRLLVARGMAASTTLQQGQVFFAPGAVVVGQAVATLGASLAPGTQVMQLSLQSRQVVVPLQGSAAGQVQAGQSAKVAFTSGSTAPIQATVTAVGPASSGASGGASGAASGAGTTNPQGSGSSSASLQAVLGPAGDAQLPAGTPSVTATIVIAQENNVLLVPIAALVATSNTGYAIEVRRTGHATALVPVTVSGYDDTSAEAAVSGTGVEAGEMVAIPSLGG